MFGSILNSKGSLEKKLVIRFYKILVRTFRKTSCDFFNRFYKMYSRFYKMSTPKNFNFLNATKHCKYWFNLGTLIAQFGHFFWAYAIAQIIFLEKVFGRFFVWALGVWAFYRPKLIAQFILLKKQFIA